MRIREVSTKLAAQPLLLAMVVRRRSAHQHAERPRSVSPGERACEDQRQWLPGWATRAACHRPLSLPLPLPLPLSQAKECAPRMRLLLLQ